MKKSSYNHKLKYSPPTQNNFHEVENTVANGTAI